MHRWLVQLQHSEAIHLTQLAAREMHWLRVQQQGEKWLVGYGVLNGVDVANTGAGELMNTGADSMGDVRYGIEYLAEAGMGMEKWWVEGVGAADGCVGLGEVGLMLTCECADLMGGKCVGLETAHTVPWRPDKLLEGGYVSTRAQTGVIYLVALSIAWLIDKLLSRLVDPESMINRLRSAPLKWPD